MKTIQLVVALDMGLILMGCGEANDPTNAALAQQFGRDFVATTVFQAAGHTAASIQNTVDQFRAALGAINGSWNLFQVEEQTRRRNWDRHFP